MSEAQRLKALEDENARLKRLLADAMLDKAALNELLSKNGRARRRAPGRRSSADGVRDQRAAGLLHRPGGPQDGSLPVLPAARDGAARTPACAGAERRRFGYRRLFVLLRLEGEASGKNRIYRLYREEGLTVRKRGDQLRNTSGPCGLACRTDPSFTDGRARLHELIPSNALTTFLEAVRVRLLHRRSACVR